MEPERLTAIAVLAATAVPTASLAAAVAAAVAAAMVEVSAGFNTPAADTAALEFALPLTLPAETREAAPDIGLPLTGPPGATGNETLSAALKCAPCAPDAHTVPAAGNPHDPSHGRLGGTDGPVSTTPTMWPLSVPPDTEEHSGRSTTDGAAASSPVVNVTSAVSPAAAAVAVPPRMTSASAASTLLTVRRTGPEGRARPWNFLWCRCRWSLRPKTTSHPGAGHW